MTDLSYDFRITEISSRGNFHIFSSSETIVTTFKYESWITNKGSANYKGQLYELRPTNIWGTRTDVYKDGRMLGELIFKWRGTLNLQIRNEAGHVKQFVLKNKGLWKMQFVLQDENLNDILHMDTSFKWSTLHFEYLVNLSDARAYNDDTFVLILCCAYGANLYMHLVAGEG